MGEKKRGIIIPIIRAFISSLKPKMARIKLVGVDYNGTKYYEDPEARHNRGRTFIPADEEDYLRDVPAEWEAWLRYRRRDPPTNEEIEANLDIMMQKKVNSKKLDEKYASEMKERYADKGQLLEAVQKNKSFPTYDDYKEFGQTYKPKKK